MTETHKASHVDKDTGIREIAEFFGPDDMGLFGLTHLPPDGAHAGVVVCSPLYAECMRNYRREVLIGRLLASRGIAVQRFHYRGHGNSQADSGKGTFDDMRSDALSAAQRLIEVAGVTRLAFFGARFGAMVAGAAAREFERCPLALWDPILDSSQYFSDMFRARRIKALKGGDDTDSPDNLIERLKEDGVIHLLGYSIWSSLYESSQGRTLEEELGPSPRPVLIVRMGNDPRLHRGLPSLVDRWQRLGFSPESQSIGRLEPWWFTAGQLLAKETLTQPVEVTVDWVTRIFQERGTGSEE
jgi:alpha/beta superfamily hydrolase